MSGTSKVAILFFCLASVSLRAAEGDVSRVHYLANAGVMVERGATKVLFDPLFENDFGTYLLVPADMQRKLFERAPPWDGIDAVFISHHHEDHFSPRLMLSLLGAHDKLHLYAPSQAVTALREIAAPSDDSLFDRITSISLKYGEEPLEFAMDGLNIDAVRIPHAGWPSARTDVENIVFRVTLDDATTVLHMGDADTSDAHFAKHNDHWAKRHTDVALPPYWYFLSESGRRVLNERIAPGHAIGLHVPKEMPVDPAQRPEEIRGYDLFTVPGEVRQID